MNDGPASNSDRASSGANGVAIGIALGLPLGSAIGMLAFDNIALGGAISRMTRMTPTERAARRST